MIYIPEARRGKELKFILRSHDAIFIEHISSSSWKIYNFARKCFMIFHDITFSETKFPSDKEFSHLHSANFRGDELRAMDDFVTSFVIASQVSAASSSIAKDVPLVIYDSIIVEPPPTVKAFVLRIHRVQRNIKPI